jgi:hypothetical protein
LSARAAAAGLPGSRRGSRFISEHPAYASIHLGTILGVLAWVGGFLALAGTFEHRFARLLGRWGTASVLVSAAIFILEFAIDGVAGQDLATAWAAAPPAAQTDLVLATHIADTMLRGPSLIAIVILLGGTPSALRRRRDA